MSAIVDLMDAWIKRKEVIESDNLTIKDMKITFEIDPNELLESISDTELHNFIERVRKVATSYHGKAFEDQIKKAPEKRNRKQNRQQIICLNCGKLFTPKDDTQKFCTVKCESIATIATVDYPKHSKPQIDDQPVAKKRTYTKSGKYSKKVHKEQQPIPEAKQPEPNTFDKIIEIDVDQIDLDSKPVPGESYYQQKIKLQKKEREEAKLINSLKDTSKIDWKLVKKSHNILSETTSI